GVLDAVVGVIVDVDEGDRAVRGRDLRRLSGVVVVQGEVVRADREAVAGHPFDLGVVARGGCDPGDRPRQVAVDRRPGPLHPPEPMSAPEALTTLRRHITELIPDVCNRTTRPSTPVLLLGVVNL